MYSPCHWEIMSSNPDDITTISLAFVTVTDRGDRVCHSSHLITGVFELVYVEEGRRHVPPSVTLPCEVA